MTVRKTVLPSGLRIVTEEISGVRSAAYGIWVNVGSRDESPKVAGASHFLEDQDSQRARHFSIH